MHVWLRFVLLGICLAASAEEISTPGQTLFAGQVREILETKCLKCHGGEKTRGELDIRTREALLRGGENGPAIIPGDPEKSLLYRKMTHAETPGMPPKSDKLPDIQLVAVAAWIKAGAPYDKPLGSGTPAIAQATPGLKITAEDRAFWSFGAFKTVSPPGVKNEFWPITPIDRFIAAAQDAHALTPAPEAPRRILIRRLYFDLLGLPPSISEVEAFENDRDPAAYTHLVDRLLANPHYGERWGRHWLDLARYADSDGYETDADRPGMYHYRDFVIQAFNEDMPYDQFVKWQVAGDECKPGDIQAQAATGFCTTGPVSVLNGDGTPAEMEQYRYDEMDDIVSTVGSTFLGLTVACARCHDHKYDPIPQRDYYRLVAAFIGTKRNGKNWKKDDKLEPASLQASLEKPLFLTDAKAEPAKAYLLGRGDPTNKKEELSLGFLSVLTPNGSPDPWLVKNRPANASTSFQRTALADWLTDPKQGAGRLLARVIVNRLWQHHFGEGLVRTPSDFGAQGDRPTHPELLDWLASELIANNWKLKTIQRLILLSAAYRMDTTSDAAKAKLDTENRWLWHRRPLRLEAEILRDSILSVSGQLKSDTFGPAVKIALPSEAMAGRNKDALPRPKADGPEQWRRSVYLFTKRSLLLPSMDVFDAPSPSASCARRSQSTVSTQALILMNDSFVRRQAGLFAERVLAEAGPTPEKQLERAYRLGLSRAPSSAEVAAGLRFLNTTTAPVAGQPPVALVNLCHVILCLNEFAYVD